MHSKYKSIYLSIIALLIVAVIINNCDSNDYNLTSTLFSNYEIQYGGGVTDIDGNFYQSVIIGKQEWMTENLKTSQYRDGTIIPNVTSNTQWTNLSSGAWAYYYNDESNHNSYGKLYNWFAVINNNGLCPDGWKVPDDDDWKQLERFLGMREAEVYARAVNRGESQNIGGLVKSKGTEYWQSPNRGATNESGFSGIPGGNRISGGNFNNISIHGFWWSSSEFNSSNAWYRLLNYNISGISRGSLDKRYGLSVRCLKIN